MSYPDIKVLQSGALERRRGYFTQVLSNWHQLAVTGTVAIWTFIVGGAFQEGDALDATLLAIAGGLSSLLICVCRLYTRVLDAAIVRLYPGIYLAERAMKMPLEIGTVTTPRRISPITGELNEESIELRPIAISSFGHRGHRSYDAIATGLTLGFGVIAYVTADRQKVISWLLDTAQTFQVVDWFLLLHLGALGLVAWGLFWWSRQTVFWPVMRIASGGIGEPRQQIRPGGKSD